jgi:hypothetical protein
MLLFSTFFLEVLTGILRVQLVVLEQDLGLLASVKALNVFSQNLHGAFIPVFESLFFFGTTPFWDCLRGMEPK